MPEAGVSAKVSPLRVMTVTSGTGSSSFLRHTSAALIVVAAFAVLVTAAVLEIQAGATAYIIGEGHWSKAQKDAVYHLYRYAEYGEAQSLVQTRKALAVPLADRAARLALEQTPIDLERARAGFLAGGNAPQDVRRLIRVFRYLADAPYLRDSIALWRQSDVEILKLQALVNEIEGRQMRTPISRDEALILQERISAIDDSLRPIVLAFSQSLLRASRLLHNFLLVVSAVIFLLIAAFSLFVLRAALRRIGESEGKFRAAFDQAAVGMLKLDRDGLVIDANAAIADILGYPRNEIAGMRLADFLHVDEHGQLLPGEDAGDWRGQDVPTDRRFRHRDGRTLWGRWTASLIRTSNDRRADRVLAIVEDVSKARQLAAEIAHQASHDALTGLINRREIERRLELALASAHEQGLRHTLCFVDLDQFKLINDTCGHAVGDLLLRQISGVLSRHLDSDDWVGRLGGDEFAILLHGDRLERAEVIAGRIRTLLASSVFPWQGRNFNTTCSIGLVEVSAETPDVGWLLRAADAACYLAKDEGRNRVRSYHESDAAITRRQNEMEWVGEVAKAISESRLQLFAQRILPIHGEGDGLIYEVLLRLLGSDGRLHAPATFLPAAERYGQAMAIDREMLRLLFDQLAADPAHLQQLELCHVNVSAQSIADPTFRAFVVERIERGRVPASKLCFEITETAVIANLTEARAFIDAVRERGCKVALDDFGSGLSSFAYLKNLEIDILKIDGVFVREMDVEAIDYALVHSICELGRTLGKRTIAEWAETDSVLLRLADVGVDYVQGFALHIPCRLDELMRDTIVPVLNRVVSAR